MSRVLIHPSTYENVSAAVERAFELFPLDVKGKKVLIKPNVLRASEAREGIVTNPKVLEAVQKKVLSMGPSSLIVGDNPGLFNYGANEDAFKKTGLMEAAGACYMNIGNVSRRVKFNPAFMPTVGVSSAVLDADVIISLPRFKTHGLTVMTGAIKNSYGILPGGQKAMLHRIAGTPERFHEMIVDVFRLRVPDLFIMDAVTAMEGNGPASPDIRDLGLVIASDNAVALDAVVAAMMGLDPGRLRFLQKAKESGLGEHDLSTIGIIGDLKVIPGFKLPPLGGEAILNNEGMQSFIRKRSAMKPLADTELCTGCGTCVEQCPVSALDMIDGIPVVDPDICITCFCCQEICPEKTITLR
jgi:uncharacterized protein (DUF362 family)/Pyruvate/2-oxoacid:ferredoxin oxidoreductase delta subunit